MVGCGTVIPDTDKEINIICARNISMQPTCAKIAYRTSTSESNPAIGQKVQLVTHKKNTNTCSLLIKNYQHLEIREEIVFSN